MSATRRRFSASKPRSTSSPRPSRRSAAPAASAPRGLLRHREHVLRVRLVTTTTAPSASTSMSPRCSGGAITRSASSPSRAGTGRAQRERADRRDRTHRRDPGDELHHFIFQQRDLLRSYFEKCRAALKDDGVSFWTASAAMRATPKPKTARSRTTTASPCSSASTSTPKRASVYVWDQHKFNPITGEAVCKIHFHFPDKSKIKNAFTYVWHVDLPNSANC